jgi:hypothetical protein
LIEKKIENQAKKLDLPLSHLQENSHKSKVDSDTDREDTFVNSEIYSVVQNQKKTSIKQG